MSQSGIPNLPLNRGPEIKIKRKKRKALMAVLLLCGIAFASPAAELPLAESAALLEKLQGHRAKFPSLTADFTEEKTTHLLNKPLIGNGTIAFQIPNKFRRELKGSNPSTTVSNGEKLWIYYPNFKEAELYILGQRQFFDDSIAALTAGLNFDRVSDFYRFRAFREEHGYRLALTPKSGGLKRMVKELAVWVDDDFKIEKTEATLPKDDRIVTTYRNQKPTPVPATTFDFTPPADAHISQPLGK